MPDTLPLKACMIRSWDGTEWHVFVALDADSPWPCVAFPVAKGIPTLAARTAALAALGYTPTGGRIAWQWTETAFEGDPDGSISLVATTTVTPLKATP